MLQHTIDRSIFTNAALLAWTDQQIAEYGDRQYSFLDSSNCFLAQYFRDRLPHLAVYGAAGTLVHGTNGNVISLRAAIWQTSVAVSNGRFSRARSDLIRLIRYEQAGFFRRRLFPVSINMFTNSTFIPAAINSFEDDARHRWGRHYFIIDDPINPNYRSRDNEIEPRRLVQERDVTRSQEMATA